MPRRARDQVREQQVASLAIDLLGRDPPVSRNKHFDAYRDPALKEAFALYRRIRALAADVEDALDRGLEIRVVDGVWGGAPAKQLRITGPATRRIAWLTPAAWAVLRARCPRIDSVSH